MTTPCRSARIALASIFVLLAASILTGQTGAHVVGNPEVSFGDHGVSQPVVEMREGLAANGPLHDKPLRLVHPNSPVASGGDPVVQGASIAASTTVTSGLNLEGLGNGFSGFSVNAADKSFAAASRVPSGVNPNRCSMNARMDVVS